MNSKWTFEQDATNGISIKLNGVEQAQIYRENNILPEDLQMAQFIIDACNEKETKQ